MIEEEYARFYKALIEAKSVPLQRFEETRWFESCLPIEELARRGVDTLRFGPMKPVGLVDPRTGREPYAAVQLRQENLMADAYSFVGFQNHLRYGEQARVLRLNSRAGAGGVFAVWSNPSQHLYLFATCAGTDDADAGTAECLFCRTDHRS